MHLFFFLSSLKGIYMEIMQITAQLFLFSIRLNRVLNRLPQIAICSACLICGSSARAGDCGASVAATATATAIASASVRVGPAGKPSENLHLPRSLGRHPFPDPSFRASRGTRAHVSGPGRSYIFLFFGIFLGCSIFHARENERAREDMTGWGRRGGMCPFSPSMYLSPVILWRPST